MNSINTVEEDEAFEVMLDLLIKKLIGIQTEFELKRGIVLKEESTESKKRKDLLEMLMKASDSDFLLSEKIKSSESIIVSIFLNV